MLDSDHVVALFRRLKPFVTNSIWVGKMKEVRHRVRIVTSEDEQMVQQIEAGQTDERVRATTRRSRASRWFGGRTPSRKSWGCHWQLRLVRIGDLDEGISVALIIHTPPRRARQGCWARWRWVACSEVVVGASKVPMRSTVTAWAKKAPECLTQKE